MGGLKYGTAVVLMALFNSEVISLAILCVLTVMAFTDFAKEALK